MLTQIPASPGNYTAGRPAPISMLVIHVMEGTARGTGLWFANSDAHASAHYGINVDGDVSQYVQDKDTAWHAGNSTVNRCSIGIELEGHVDDPDAFTPKMMAALATLARDLCAKYGIPIDRQHLVGHCEVPDPRHPGQLGGADHHKDPGQYFDFDALMSAIAQPAELA